jgi:hypothetical protein
MHTCKVQINIVAMLSLAKQRHQAKVFEMHEELQVPTCSPCFTIQPTLSAIKNIGKFHLYRLSGLAIALITGFISFLLPTVDNITTLKLLRSWYDISPQHATEVGFDIHCTAGPTSFGFIAHTIKTVACHTNCQCSIWDNISLSLLSL